MVRTVFWLVGVALVFGLSVVGDAWALEPLPEDASVARVEVEGNRRIEEAVVLAAINLRRGDRLTPERLRRDLKSVYQTGFFDDVVIDVEATPEGSVVRFQVVEKPAVREVRIEGNRRINEDDIREVLDVRAFSVLNEASVKDNAARVRDLYLEKGFYLAVVDPKFEVVGTDQVDVVFDIVENRKVVVQRIEFSGNRSVPDGRIKRFLQVKEGGFLPWLTNSGTFRRDLLEADQQTVSAVFLEAGFLDVQVEPPKVYLSPDKRYIFISYEIDEGDQYTVGKVDVGGDFVEEEGLTRDAALQVAAGRAVPDIQEEQWRSSEERGKRLFQVEVKGPRMEPGAVFTFSTMHQVRANIESLWTDQGYAFVNVIPDVRPDPTTRTADITYQVQKGERVRIGRINVAGNDPTFDKVIRREVQVDEGDVYRGSLVTASRARLLRLGFFEDIAVTTPRGDGDDVLDLNVKVSERPTGSVSLGMGYSNLERLVVTGSFQKANFLGLGFNMNAAINWSSLRQQGNLSFFDPYFLDSRWTLSVDAFAINRQFQVTNDEFQRGGSVAVGRYLDARDDIQLRLQYTIEDVGLNNIDAYRQRLLGGDLYRNGLTSTVSFILNVDKRNDRIFPTQGFLTQLSTALSGGFRVGEGRVLNLLGGDFNFIESRFNFRLYQPLLPNGNDSVVFRLNTTLGDIRSTDGREIAFIHRYRAGGIQSMRGFQWFSLGPAIRYPTGQAGNDDPALGDDRLIVGGTQTWVNNFEVEAMLVSAAGISAVAFFDAGNAFAGPFGSDPISPFALRTSIGAGIRWRSPIGPLRFELGFPLRPEEGERTSVFDFGIGSFF